MMLYLSFANFLSSACHVKETVRSDADSKSSIGLTFGRFFLFFLLHKWTISIPERKPEHTQRLGNHSFVRAFDNLTVGTLWEHFLF
jgi:hypothetical protein